MGTDDRAREFFAADPLLQAGGRSGGTGGAVPLMRAALLGQAGVEGGVVGRFRGRECPTTSPCREAPPPPAMDRGHCFGHQDDRGTVLDGGVNHDIGHRRADGAGLGERPEHDALHIDWPWVTRSPWDRRRHLHTGCPPKSSPPRGAHAEPRGLQFTRRSALRETGCRDGCHATFARNSPIARIWVRRRDAQGFRVAPTPHLLRGCVMRRQRGETCPRTCSTS